MLHLTPSGTEAATACTRSDAATRTIRLINPNMSKATTDMMAGIARSVLPAGFSLEAATARTGVPMILDAAQLAASEEGVVEMARSDGHPPDGIIISAFGDPGLEAVRKVVDCPVVGLCEAGILEASCGNRPFGIATVTPALVASFARKADDLGVGHLFTGTQLTDGDPEALVRDPGRLEDALFEATRRCLSMDGARAVIIGGGPLGQCALALRRRFEAPIIAPIPAAVALLLRRMDERCGRTGTN